MIRLPLLLMFIISMAISAGAQGKEFAPGTEYDPSIPTVRQVLGHQVGERITTPEQIGQYLRALHGAAPNRTRLIRYAQSWSSASFR